MSQSGGVLVGLTSGTLQSCVKQTSSGATALLALLEEKEDALKVFALEKMNANVDEYWFQLSGSVAHVEALFEDDEFSHRELAALVASKVFYHLDDLDDAVTYALGAATLFDVDEDSDYCRTVLACCLDTYTSQRKEAAKNGRLDEDGIDKRLLAIVERLYCKCVDDKQYQQAIGLALESHRLDLLEKTIMAASESVLLVNYALMATQKSVTSKRYRDEILNSIITMHGKLGNQDLSAVVKCLIILDESEKAAEILTGLIKGSSDDILMSYQIAFDIFEAEQQSFISSLRKQLSITFNIHPRKDIDEKEDGNMEPMEAENVTETTALMQDADGAEQKQHSQTAFSKVTAAALRSIDKSGGLDKYILSNKKLESERGLKLRMEILKQLDRDRTENVVMTTSDQMGSHPPEDTETV